MSVFLMAGGGTGGHVVPGLAVARELRRRGHEPFFIGTRKGMEASLVPAEGFPIEYIEIGGLKRVGLLKKIQTLWQLPLSVVDANEIMRKRQPAAVFSMGGYAAAPVMIAAFLRGMPVVLMEPNAMPGLTSRRFGRWVDRALLSFEEALRFFPSGKTEITGLPVRREFFEIPPRQRKGADPVTILVTGGSRGSRTLNKAARAAWELFRKSSLRIYLIHQTGQEDYEEISRAFSQAGVPGEVTAFISDMPAQFARADIIVGRSGAGAVAEIAAAGKPSILVPFPYAADDHQYYNAKALADAGAARLVRDAEMNGERFFQEIQDLVSQPGLLERMGNAARAFARPGAAERAADILENLSFRT